MQELEKLLKEKYDIVFNQVALLDQAFTHSSYVNEHRLAKLSDNERLEFLGDAVLEIIVSEFLYDQYQDVKEGELTRMRARIVQEDSLSKFAVQCGFDEHVKLGKGEENTGGRKRPALLCDLFESFLGALYLDQGVEKARLFIETVIFPKIKAGMFDKEMDYKTRLQEVLQRSGNAAIEYRLIEEVGPAHDRNFTIEVYSKEKCLGKGIGRSKKAAEQDAAKKALEKIEN